MKKLLILINKIIHIVLKNIFLQIYSFFILKFKGGGKNCLYITVISLYNRFMFNWFIYIIYSFINISSSYNSCFKSFFFKINRYFSTYNSYNIIFKSNIFIYIIYNIFFFTNIFFIFLILQNFNIINNI